VQKKDADTIASVRAYCSQNATEYSIAAPLFCDASGDGVVGFLSGAAFRMGAESKEEFGEMFAPSSEYGELLGHSIYFYTKDIGKPVSFVPPSYALNDITKIPKYKKFSAKEQGCQLWWIEYGGRLDTVHDTEKLYTVSGTISRTPVIFPKRRILHSNGLELSPANARAEDLKATIYYTSRTLFRNVRIVMPLLLAAGRLIFILPMVSSVKSRGVINGIAKEYTLYRTAVTIAGTSRIFFWQAALSALVTLPLVQHV
jgi:hypothetical protein